MSHLPKEAAEMAMAEMTENAAATRTALGLGTAALRGVGTSAGTVAAGNDSRFDAIGTNTAAIAAHAGRTDNPHNVNPAQIGAISTSQKAQANGVASLDNTGKVPTAQLPSIAPSGAAGGDLSGTYPNPILAIPRVTQASYDAFVATKNTANGFAGLDSSTKILFSQLPTGTSGTTVAVGNHTHADATTSASGFMSAADKVKLDKLGVTSVQLAHGSHGTLMLAGGTADIALSFPSPMPSAAWKGFLSVDGAVSVLGAVTAIIKAGTQTANGCTVAIKNTGLAAIPANAGIVVSLLAVGTT